MSIFELILTSMAGLKKVTHDKYIPECESSESCKFLIFQGQGNMPSDPSLEGHVALQDTMPPIQV